MRRFDPEVLYDSENSMDSSNVSKSTRDPYFERYELQIYQELAENPSALFNFFYENNDILNRINKTDYAYLQLVYTNWYYKCNNALWGSFAATAVLDLLVLRKTVGPKVPKFFKPIYFLFKYVGVPLLSYQATNKYLDIEKDFIAAAEEYNFGYEDFEQALAIFEKAKIVNKLDLLLKERGNFDFSQLDNIELEYNRDEAKE
jgi:hypothetical protein